MLEILARNSDGRSLAELSGELGVPKSSLLGLIRPFVTAGYLMRVSGDYLLGPPMYRLAAQILSTRGLLRQLRPFLKELAERSQETVYLAVLDREAKVTTFIDTVASAKAVRFAMPIGFVRPLHATAAGRLLLAYQDSDWQESYFSEAQLTSITPRTTTDPAAIRTGLLAIRSIGVSISLDEAVEGGGAIAAPIFDPQGNVEAALLIAAPTERLKQNLPVFQHLVTEVARRASGYISTEHAQRLDQT